MKVDRSITKSRMLKIMPLVDNSEAFGNALVQLADEMTKEATANIEVNEADFPIWAYVFESIATCIKMRLEPFAKDAYEDICKLLMMASIDKEGNDE